MFVRQLDVLWNHVVLVLHTLLNINTASCRAETQEEHFIVKQAGSRATGNQASGAVESVYCSLTCVSATCLTVFRAV